MEIIVPEKIFLSALLEYFTELDQPRGPGITKPYVRGVKQTLEKLVDLQNSPAVGGRENAMVEIKAIFGKYRLKIKTVFKEK